MPSSKISWDDTVLPFQLDQCDVRGRFGRLDGVLNQVLSQHHYPKEIEALIAEVSLLTALIGQTIKLKWKLSIQVRGDGPVKLIATDYYAPQKEGDIARIRAYASFDEDKIQQNSDPFSQIGRGFFAILIDQGSGMTPYQGITPLDGGSLSSCAEAYFAQSEQLLTRFELSFGRSTLPGEPESWRAGGIMVQKMPKASPFAAMNVEAKDETLTKAEDILSGDDLDGWNRVNLHLGTVEKLELIGPTIHPTGLLHRLFHEEAPRIFDLQPVKFGCSCSEERVRTSLSIYSVKDIEHMTTDAGILTADCQFCGAHYKLDPKTVGKNSESRPDVSTD